MSGFAFFDMDGTLSDDSNRRQYYVPGQFTEYWDERQMLSDPLYPEAGAVVNSLVDMGWSYGILSARLESYNRNVTETWLAEHGLVPDFVWLRTDLEKGQNPVEFKVNRLRFWVENVTRYDSIVHYDNDQDVVDAITSELGSQYVQLCTWDRDGDSGGDIPVDQKKEETTNDTPS